MNHLFIGLGVHKNSWSVTIQEGSIVPKRFSMQACSAALIRFVSKHYPSYSVECCYECCCVGYHIYRDLSAAGWQELMVNPGDISRIGKQSSKTDKINSRHFCQQLASGHLESSTFQTSSRNNFAAF